MLHGNAGKAFYKFAKFREVTEMKKLILRLVAAGTACTAVACFCACSSGGDETGSAGGAIYYTVMFDSRGGSEVESARVLAGNPAPRLETPVREGYFLTGWYEDPAATDDEWHFDTDRVTSNITLYAGWELSGTAEATASLVYERYGDGYAVTDVGEETEIVIPAEYEGLPVVAIRDEYGNGVFSGKAITSVTVPDSVTEIARNAFYNCAALAEINIGAGSALATIGGRAFSGCSSLEEVYIPASVISIGDSAFNNCGSISFTVAENNAAYRSPNGHLVERGTNTLLRGGRSGDIPNGVEVIAQAAFRYAQVTQISVPASVREIGNYAFDYNENLEYISVDEGNDCYSSADGVLYNAERTELIFAPEGLQGEIALPVTLSAIPSFAFDGRTGLTGVYIANENLESIGSFAFRGCGLEIRFAGTREAWDAIPKNQVWNTGAQLTYVCEAQA